MAAHQAVVARALLPTGVPASSPRTVSMNGVNGWWAANHCTAGGIESVGANPLLRKGSSTRNMGELLADSTDVAAMPMATVSQVRANPIMASTPNAASHCSAVAEAR